MSNLERPKFFPPRTIWKRKFSLPHEFWRSDVPGKKVIWISSWKPSCRVLNHLSAHNSLNGKQFWIIKKPNYWVLERYPRSKKKFFIKFRTVTEQMVSDNICTSRKRSKRPCSHLKINLSILSVCNVCIEQKLITRTYICSSDRNINNLVLLLSVL